MNLRFCVAVGLLSTVLAGCSIVLPTPHYATSTDNFFALRDLKGRQINLGPFTSSNAEKQKTCRGMVSVTTPNGGDFSEYVRTAFERELRSAGVYSPGAPVTLTGNVDVLELAGFKGEWNLALTLKSSNGRSMTVSSKTSFNTLWDAQVACRLAATEFVRATQSLVAKAVNAPEFIELTR